MKLIAKVNNMPDLTQQKIEKYGKYIVVRVVGIELWYWGIFPNLRRAEIVAEELNNGIVLEVEVEE